MENLSVINMICQTRGAEFLEAG